MLRAQVHFLIATPPHCVSTGCRALPVHILGLCSRAGLGLQLAPLVDSEVTVRICVCPVPLKDGPSTPASLPSPSPSGVLVKVTAPSLIPYSSAHVPRWLPAGVQFRTTIDACPLLCLLASTLIRPQSSASVTSWPFTWGHFCLVVPLVLSKKVLHSLDSLPPLPLPLPSHSFYLFKINKMKSRGISKMVAR
jgi:hypothetical protein